MRFIFSVVTRLALFLCTLLITQISVANEVATVKVMRGFSIPLKLSENAGTIAIGDPNLIGVVTIKPDVLMVNGQDTGATSLTVFGKSGNIYQYRIQITNDVSQLRTLIASIEKKVIVEDVNGTVVLKGEVPTAAALARILSVADRFMDNSDNPDFTVVSDNGGVLAGNLKSEEHQEQKTLAINTQVLAVGGGGRGGNGNSGRGGSGGTTTNGGGGFTASNNQTMANNKGNLGQNIGRAGVVMSGKGKVISLIKVVQQPKVEIQMQIVAVDRKKTDEFGLDWRLDGSNVTIGSTLGKVSSSALLSPKQLATDGFTAGEASLVGFFSPGKYLLSTFLRAVEEKGAAKTLSEPLITAISGETASFLVGGNIPIPVQTATTGGNNSAVAVTTNVQFLEFGLKLVVRPTVLENGKISIVLDQSISQPDYSNAIQILGAQIPSFTLKTISTTTESSSGETWAVAGLLSEEDTKSLKSIPWISKVPIIGWLFSNKDDRTSRNELMILVNARRVDGVNATTTSFDKLGDFGGAKSQHKEIEPALIKDYQQAPESIIEDSSVDNIPAQKKASENQNSNSIANNHITKMVKPNDYVKRKPATARKYRPITTQPSSIMMTNPL